MSDSGNSQNEHLSNSDPWERKKWLSGERTWKKEGVSSSECNYLIYKTMQLNVQIYVDWMNKQAIQLFHNKFTYYVF